jgi:hypothetical protein
MGRAAVMINKYRDHFRQNTGIHHENSQESGDVVSGFLEKRFSQGSPAPQVIHFQVSTSSETPYRGRGDRIGLPAGRNPVGWTNRA